MSRNLPTETEIKFIVQYFNAKHSTRYSPGTSDIQESIEFAFENLGHDISTIKQAIKDFVPQDESQSKIREFFAELKPNQEENPVMPNPIAQVADGAKPEVVVNQTLGLLEQAIADIFVKTKGNEIADQVLGSVEDKVKDFIAKEYGTIKRKVEFDFQGNKVKFDEQLHERFEDVLAFVASNEPVFLSGPAGSGKNVICKQVAKSLNLDFYFSNAVTQEYKITGFTDAMGVFHESQFYKAFTQGGLFMLDEMDGSIPEVLIILNSAIANKYFDFPAPIGYKEAHPDFRIVSAGNTFGHGASYTYVGRNQLDGASLDRFAVIEIEYSENIELACANNDENLVKFIRQYRRACEDAGVNTIVSYRSITRIVKMSKPLGIEKALKTCLTKNLEGDDIRMIINKIESKCEYSQALRKLAS